MLMRLREEHGFSLITAVLISIVVFILSLVTIGLSIHNTSQSGRNRERVNAVAAAEAGLNFQFARLQTGQFDAGCTRTENLGSFPRSSFTTTISLTNLAGQAIACPPVTPPSKARALIRSVGKTTGSDPVRTMEALVELERVPGGLFGEGAIFGEGDILIDSNPDIGGALNADVYSNGNIELKSNPQVNGSVMSQKCIKMDSTAKVYVDVWAKGGAGCNWSSDTITMLSNTTAVRNVKATTGNVVFGSSSWDYVSGDADAGGSTMSNWPGSGNTTATHPNVVGTARRNQTGLTAPPLKPFPEFTYNPDDWTSAGYVVEPVSSCEGAKKAIGVHASLSSGSAILNASGAGFVAGDVGKKVTGAGIPSGTTVVSVQSTGRLTMSNPATATQTSFVDFTSSADPLADRVIRINSTCLLFWSLSSTSPIVLTKDIAIITDGAVFLDSNTRFISSNTDPVAGKRTLHFIVGRGDTFADDYCFQMKSSSRIENPIVTLVHARKKSDQTKCRIFLDSNADIAKGQIFGGNRVDVNSNTDMTYEPVITPGAPSSGFKESVIYIREVRSN